MTNSSTLVLSHDHKCPPPFTPLPVFQPLVAPARYKGAWGGRGSGKSHFFAELLVRHCLEKPRLLAVSIREIQKSLKDSAKRLIEARIAALGLGEADGFRSYSDRIRTPHGGIIIFQGMQDHNAESIKSLEGFDRAWVEEAQCLSPRSLALLRPTIRAPGSQLWFSWNPRRKSDPVDLMLRGPDLPSGAKVVRANWSDNPHLSPELEAERLDCLRTAPAHYAHIWEGEHVTISEGAYYARELAAAREEGRIAPVAFDPLLPVRLFFDIGGTGGRADACAIWPAQFVGAEIRLRDYYEAQGQPLGHHAAWLRARGYGPERAQIWLPHDGATHDRVHRVSYESALRDAGWQVHVVPNQGKGAAAARIEAARRLFGAIRFDEASTSGGRDALGWYHEGRDETRQIGLGPVHDWSSHGADAFGLMCVAYEAPSERKIIRKIKLGGWMS